MSNNDIEKATKDGKVLKEVTVTRGGKTFKQKRWVRASETVEGGKKKKDAEMPEALKKKVEAKQAKEESKKKREEARKKAITAKQKAERATKKEPKKDKEKVETSNIPDTHFKDLQQHSKKLNEMPVGKEVEIKKGVVAKKLSDGSFTIKAFGKKMLVHGASAASMIIDYTHKVASTGGAAFAGDLPGRGIERESAVSETGKKVAAKVKEKASKPEKKKEEPKNKEKKEKK